MNDQPLPCLEHCGSKLRHAHSLSAENKSGLIEDSRKIMKYKNNWMPEYLILLILSLIMVFSAGSVWADDEAAPGFSDLIAQLKEQSVIPDLEGNFLSFGDFEDSYTNMGYFSGTPIIETENFVLSTNISWSSANQTPNSITSGCGIIFDYAANGSSDHLLLSFRMDGNIYMTGHKGYNNLSYGKKAYTLPSVLGEVDLVLVYNGGNAAIYANGNLIMQKNGLPFMGEALGFAVLSGTYQDFGTRCNFRDINVYTWHDAAGADSE